MQPSFGLTPVPVTLSGIFWEDIANANRESVREPAAALQLPRASENLGPVAQLVGRLVVCEKICRFKSDRYRRIWAASNETRFESGEPLWRGVRIFRLVRSQSCRVPRMLQA